MSLPVRGASNQTIRQLAIKGLHSIVSVLKRTHRTEKAALILFSSLYETKVNFTKDYDSLLSGLHDLKPFYDKSLLHVALEAASSLILSEYGSLTFVKVVVLTDGLFVRELQDLPPEGISPNFFLFPNELHFVCLSEQPSPLIADILSANNGSGRVWKPRECATAALEALFDEIGKSVITPQRGLLHLGNLQADVSIAPQILVTESPVDLSILGFLESNHLAVPGVASKHAILPVNSDNTFGTCGGGADDEGNFCSLLHGALVTLKQPPTQLSLVAIVQIRNDWFGYVTTQQDARKRSNLFLHLFHRGVDAVPWLGRLDHLASSALIEMVDGVALNFPVDLSQQHSQSNASISANNEVSKRSYVVSTSHPTVVWLKTHGLHTDLQKVLRCSRRLPDKQAVFLKEVNRVRRIAASFGFEEVLSGIADLLHRESETTQNQTASMLLEGTASLLRATPSLAYDNDITLAMLQASQEGTIEKESLDR